jgi:hypothetical protein
MEDSDASTVGEPLRLILNFLLIMTTVLSLLTAIFFFGVTAMVAPPLDQRAGVQWGQIRPAE